MGNHQRIRLALRTVKGHRLTAFCYFSFPTSATIRATIFDAIIRLNIGAPLQAGVLMRGSCCQRFSAYFRRAVAIALGATNGRLGVSHDLPDNDDAYEQDPCQNQKQITH